VSTVRSDLVGVVYGYDSEGNAVKLQAGDRVPAGVELGDHVKETDKKPTARSSKS